MASSMVLLINVYRHRFAIIKNFRSGNKTEMVPFSGSHLKRVLISTLVYSIHTYFCLYVSTLIKYIGYSD